MWPVYVTSPSTLEREFSIDKRLIGEDPNTGIEVRCVMVNGIIHDQTWPDAGELYFNNVKVKSYQPLNANSSLKKRKDEKYFTKFS